jgi:molybdopterin molybdotransferase
MGVGTAVEIATGAPLPPGADAVVMVERTLREHDVVSVLEGVTAGQNVGRRGADLSQGSAVIELGDWITPARAGSLAAIGRTSLSVFAKPRVAVFATGQEVAPLGRELHPTEIYDVNTTTISAVVGMHGGIAHPLPPVGDSIDGLRVALHQAATDDVVVCSGGSSVGSRDLVTDAITASGEVLLHGIAIKPGKPTLVGRLDQTVVFGMPGNPTSCLSNAYLLLAPFLRAVARLPAWRPAKTLVPLAASVRSTPGRHHFYSVRLVEGRAVPAFKSSGDITSLACADGYIEIPPDVPAPEAGDLVTVTLF